jgi:hypothetical protein
MNLEKELKALRRERREAVADLHRTFVRTKQDVRRMASPNRFIRRHLGASLGAAALVGLLLAPRPTRKPEKQKLSREPSESVGAHFRRLLKHALARIDHAVDPGHHTEQKKPSGMAGKVIASLLPMLMKKFNVTQLVSQFMAGRGMSHNGHEPDISVANAGTVGPDAQ